MIEGVINAVTEAMARGDRKAAAAAYMGFWLGRLQWWLSPRKLKENIIETVDKVALEFLAAKWLSAPPLDVYTALDVPTLLIHGGKTRRPSVAVIAGAGGIAARRAHRRRRRRRPYEPADPPGRCEPAGAGPYRGMRGGQGR